MTIYYTTKMVLNEDNKWEGKITVKGYVIFTYDLINIFSIDLLSDMKDKHTEEENRKIIEEFVADAYSWGDKSDIESIIEL